jgi:hypothetical protein
MSHLSVAPVVIVTMLLIIASMNDHRNRNRCRQDACSHLPDKTTHLHLTECFEFEVITAR